MLIVVNSMWIELCVNSWQHKANRSFWNSLDYFFSNILNLQLVESLDAEHLADCNNNNNTQNNRILDSSGWRGPGNYLFIILWLVSLNVLNIYVTLWFGLRSTTLACCMPPRLRKSMHMRGWKSLKSSAVRKPVSFCSSNF